VKELQLALAEIKRELLLSPLQIRKIAVEFSQAIKLGLAAKPSPLKMLPSFLTPPGGGEAGSYLALDLGGTNARAALMDLQGKGRWDQSLRVSVPLKDPVSGFDFRSAEASASELFDFLAGLVDKVVTSAPAKTYHLGFTFSFPSNQTCLARAKLIRWTKEFQTSGVVGEDVGGLLEAALERRGLRIRVKAIINDTVGSLLTSAYQDQHTSVGSILGTGHNSCYTELHAPIGKEPMIINLEAGNFNLLPFTPYDQVLDEASEDRGHQRLEKMVSGKYIGEVARLIFHQLIVNQLLFKGRGAAVFTQPYSLESEQLSLLLADASQDLAQTQGWLAGLGISASHRAERAALQEIAAAVALRSARLVAATYLGVQAHTARLQPQTIAVDGSLYERMPGYADHLAAALGEGQAGVGQPLRLRLVKDGSLIGAAIAAAIGSAYETS